MANNHHQTILVVDDDPVSLTLITKLVEKLDYEVFQAENGLEAQQVLEHHAVDLVIADHEMPECTGLELLKWVHAGYPSLPFILVTAYSNVKVVREAWENGAFDFFQKPIFIDRLKQTIEIAISYGHLKLARRRFPETQSFEPDPSMLDLPVLRELAAALDAPDLAAIVAEFDVHARIELEQMLRFNHAKNYKAAKQLAHRLAGTAINLGLSKISQEFRAIETNSEKPILNHRRLDEMLEASIYWLKYHLSDILHDLAS
jgi:CheY-like chemotaxis protein